jgi:hypothetical protein
MSFGPNLGIGPSFLALIYTFLTFKKKKINFIFAQYVGLKLK